MDKMEKIRAALFLYIFVCEIAADEEIALQIVAGLTRIWSPALWLKQLVITTYVRILNTVYSERPHVSSLKILESKNQNTRTRCD
jgi:ubiquitin-protein ligase